MTHTIDPHGRLVIAVEPAERKLLRQLLDEDPKAFTSNQVLHDVFEHLVANSELDWVGPEVCADLTDAPILAILGETEAGPAEDGSGYILVGFWDGQPRRQPVLFRWAFMAYAVTSPQEKLLERGQCVWEGGHVHADRNGNGNRNSCGRRITGV